MKKVLVITYYWPPSGGGGVQRWLKFVKYLPQFGWEPIVYTPENPEYPSLDQSLLKDVSPDLKIIRHSIFEPYGFYKRFVGLKKGDKINTGFLSESKKPKKAEGIAVWIRGNLFIPDARKFWIKPSVSYLSNYLKENPVDVVVTTGPPHSMHLIGFGLKKKLGLKWVADFRDPWTNIDFYEELKLSSWADKKHHRLEQKVLDNADGIIGVGKGYIENLLTIPKTTPIKIITNGFDEDDFENIIYAEREEFTISHFGSMNKTRNPEGLWKALSKIKVKNPELFKIVKVKLFGKVDHMIISSAAKYGLADKVELVDYIPHDKMMKELVNSSLLLLIINNISQGNRLIPGKVFEYIGSGKPILGLGTIDSEIAEILKESESGKMLDWNDVGEIEAYIITELNKSKNEDLPNRNKHKYSRKFLTNKLVQFLNDITNK